jgi:hypothetical protein
MRYARWSLPPRLRSISEDHTRHRSNSTRQFRGATFSAAVRAARSIPFRGIQCRDLSRRTVPRLPVERVRSVRGLRPSIPESERREVAGIDGRRHEADVVTRRARAVLRRYVKCARVRCGTDSHADVRRGQSQEIAGCCKIRVPARGTRVRRLAGWAAISHDQGSVDRRQDHAARPGHRRAVGRRAAAARARAVASVQSVIRNPQSAIRNVRGLSALA